MAWNDAPPTVEGLGMKKVSKWSDAPPRAEEISGPSFSEKAKRFGSGLGYGIVDALNPINAPQGLEVLARAPFQEVDQSKGFIDRTAERFSKAQESAWLPNAQEIGAGLRTGFDIAKEGKFPSIKEVKDLYKKEKAIQGLPSEVYPEFGAGKAVGEVGTGAIQLLMGAAQGVKSISKIPEVSRDIATKLGLLKKAQATIDAFKIPKTTAKEFAAEALKEAGLSRQSIDKAKTAQKLANDLLGEVAPEVGDALFNRTQKVESLLRGGRDAQSLYPEVQSLRKTIDDSNELAGQTVGAYRDFIKQTSDIRISTAGLVKQLSSVANELKTESGISTITPADQYLIAKYKYLLSAPKKARGVLKEDLVNSGSFDEIIDQLNPKEKASFLNSLVKDVPEDALLKTKDIPISDALKISDAADKDLQGFYAGRVQGNPSRAVMAAVAGMRNKIKANLHDKFPAYGQADEAYTNMKNVGEQIKGKIESTGAESFLSNLFGVNKTEQRALLEEYINASKLTSKKLSEIRPGVSPGVHPLKNDFSELANQLRSRAEASSYIDSKEFLNSVADKITARKLSLVSSSGMADFPADKIERLSRKYAEEAAAIAESRAGKAGGSAFGFIGGLLGGAGGAFAGKAGGVPGMIGGSAIGTMVGAEKGYKIGNFVFGKPAGLAAKIAAEKEAAQIYNPFNLLKQIQASKTAAKESKKIAEDVLLVQKHLGDEPAMKLMNIIPINKDFMGDLIKAGYRGGTGIEAIMEGTK